MGVLPNMYERDWSYIFLLYKKMYIWKIEFDSTYIDALSYIYIYTYVYISTYIHWSSLITRIHIFKLDFLPSIHIRTIYMYHMTYWNHILQEINLIRICGVYQYTYKNLIRIWTSYKYFIRSYYVYVRFFIRTARILYEFWILIRFL